MTRRIKGLQSDKTPISEVLRSLRRRRGLRSVDVASAMGMPLRSYEHFEAGAVRLNPERIHQFAEAIGVDAFAIFAALDMGSPAFAVRCADNKFMTVLIMTLQNFDANAGDDIARLAASTLFASFTRCFDELASQASAQDAFVEQWMAEKGLRTPGEPKA